MKKIIILALLAANLTSYAQIYRDRIGFDLESIADIDIGWMAIRKHTTAPKGKQLGDRIYSAKQIGYSQLFTEWMQQSYLPKGCLGNATYYQNYIPKFSSSNSLLGNAINMNDNALPHLYGARSRIYMFLKKNEKGNFVPQNNLDDEWNIEANGLNNISTPISFISSKEKYYFIIPDFKNNIKGYKPEDLALSNLSGFDNHKNIAGYKHFFNTKYQDQSYIVILAKNNILPFDKITIGEFFTQAEEQFPVWQKIDPVPAEQFATAQKNLARLKEKYKNKWNDIAEIKLDKTQINLASFVNATEGYDDMFDNNATTRSFPILKVNKKAQELCKSDQPQWLVIRWDLGMQNSRYFIHLHESILNNFNFNYVYNFLFDPEKVKGQSYKPLRSPSYKEAVVVNEASVASKKNSSDKNIYFFEDFSTTAIGKSPVGWQATPSSGKSAVVTQPEGLEGNWVELKGHTINATLLKKPFPQNFTLSYELTVPQNFTWGAKGLAFQLSKETSPGNAESYVNLRLRPGFNGRDGEAIIETKLFNNPPGYYGTKNTTAPGFSNNKKYNRITVIIKKKEELLEIFIDKNKIAAFEKAIPASLLFNALSFTHGRSDGETEKFFISNIKITKE